MYYDINISKNGSHIFATSERSSTSKRNAELLFNEFKKRFPESEGFKISVSFWAKSGTDRTSEFETQYKNLEAENVKS